MKDRYVPPYRIETAEQLVRVFSSWNHHAQSKGAWRLYSKEEIENTPSRRDGVSAYSERRYKRLLITLIWKVAEALASPMVTIVAAAVMLQRFYGERSFVHNDKLVIATACLFLAGKMEDTPRSLHRISEHMYEAFCVELSPIPLSAAKARWQNTAYQENFKAAVLAAERSLLATLGFNFSLTIPHHCLVHPQLGIGTILNSAIDKACSSAPPGRDLQRENVHQAAYDICNESLRCDATLTHSPLAIAISAMYFSLKYHGIMHLMPGGLRWYTQWPVSEEQILEVCSAQTEMYIECAPKLLAATPSGHEAVVGTTDASAAGVNLPDSTLRPKPEPRSAEQQQAWLSAKAAAIGAQHSKQEQHAAASSDRSDQPPQAAQAQSHAVATPQPGLFMPVGSSAQRGLDHKVRSDRRSADRGVPAVPKFQENVTGSNRTQRASPHHDVKPQQMQELVETDMFSN